MADRFHKRAEIRSAIVDALKTIPDVSNRVYPVRRLGVSDEDLPAILVYTESERADRLDNINYRRTLTVRVEAQAEGATESDTIAILDGLAAKIEEVFLNNERFGGLLETSILTNTEEALDEAGRSIIGAVRLSYECIYYTENVFPDVTDLAENLNGIVAGLPVNTDLPQ